MRPRANSTADLISRQCSSTSTVGDSPVVPTMTIAGGAVRDVEVDQPAERGKIERAAFGHRRRDGDEAAGQHGECRQKSAILPHSTRRAGPVRFSVRRRRGGSDGRPRARRADGREPLHRPRCARPRRDEPFLERDHGEAAGDDARAARPARAGNPDSTAGRTPRCRARTSRRAARRRRRAPRAGAGTAGGAGSWRRRSRRSARRASGQRAASRDRAARLDAGDPGERRERVASRSTASTRQPRRANSARGGRARRRDRARARRPATSGAKRTIHGDGGSSPCAGVQRTASLIARDRRRDGGAIAVARCLACRLVGEPARRTPRRRRARPRAARRPRSSRAPSRSASANGATSRPSRRCSAISGTRPSATPCPRHRGLDHLVVELEAQRRRRASARAARSPRARRSTRATACGLRDRRDAAARAARDRPDSSSGVPPRRDELRAHDRHHPLAEEAHRALRRLGVGQIADRDVDFAARRDRRAGRRPRCRPRCPDAARETTRGAGSPTATRTTPSSTA